MSETTPEDFAEARIRIVTTPGGGREVYVGEERVAVCNSMGSANAMRARMTRVLASAIRDYETRKAGEHE